MVLDLRRKHQGQPARGSESLVQVDGDAGEGEMAGWHSLRRGPLGPVTWADHASSHVDPVSLLRVVEASRKQRVEIPLPS